MTSWHHGNFLGAWALFWLVAHIRKHLQRLMKPSSSHCFYYRCLQVVYDASSLLSINRDSITDDIICVFSRQVQYLVWDCEKRRWFCRNLCKARIKCRPGDLCFLLRLYWDFTKLHFLKMKKNLLFEGILLSLIGLKPTKVHIQSQANKHRSTAFRNQAKESGTLAGAIWRGKTHRSRDSWLVTTVCLLCLVEACYTSSFWTNQSSFTITSSWEEKENKQT